MPIKNLSDVRRLPRLGKIALGVKKKSSGGKDYPAEVDYFVCPDKVKAVFGETPKELRIMFPVNNAEIFFAQWYKCYGASALKCKGDGEKAFTWDEEAGGMKEIPCPCPKLESGECKQIGILQFLIPEVAGAGVWQITTSSKNSIIDLNSSIDFVRAICGRVNMIPLVLKREEHAMTRTEKNGQQKKSVHYTMRIDADKNATIGQLQEAAQTKPEMVCLPPPDESKDDLLYPENGFSQEDPAVETEAKVVAPRKGQPNKLDDIPVGEESAATTEQMADIATWTSELKERGKSDKAISSGISKVAKEKCGIDMSAGGILTIDAAQTVIAALKGWVYQIDAKREAAL